MKVDLAFLCDTVEVDCQGGKTRTQMYGVYKTDVMELVLDIVTADEVLEVIDYDKIIDYLEEKYDIEPIKRRD